MNLEIFISAQGFKYILPDRDLYMSSREPDLGNHGCRAITLHTSSSCPSTVCGEGWVTNTDRLRDRDKDGDTETEQNVHVCLSMQA